MKSNLFLVTATLVLIVMLCRYEPPELEQEETVEEPFTETVIVNDVVVAIPVEPEGWYEQQMFEQTPFDMVRASFNYKVPVIEIVQARESKDIDADAYKLKAVIEEKIGKVHLFLLDTENQDRVAKIYE